MLYKIMLVFDVVLFVYFTKIALNTTNRGARFICCLAMTYEIYLMRHDLKKIMKKGLGNK